MAGACRRGRLDRRAFLTQATALGLSRGAALGAIGVAAGTHEVSAQGNGPPPLRIQMDVRASGDPRRYDWAENANVSRGLLEYLVRYNRDGSFTGRLLDRWDVNEDATEYVLHLRRDVTWNTGAPFTADDVIANFDGWADMSVTGNSMAPRMAALVDPATGRARDGAIGADDAHTVRLRLNRPDVTLIASIADFPAAIQQRDLIGTDPLDHNVGTGAYRIVEHETARIAVLERAADHAYWGETALDRVEFHDLGADAVRWFNAARAGRIDMLYRSEPYIMGDFDTLGWLRHAVDTASTVVVRTNQGARVGGIAPYADPRVRRALAMAVDNRVVLELGIDGLGSLGQNDHVSPIHPDHANLAPIRPDTAMAAQLMAEAGMGDHVHELVSVDDTWRRDTADAVGAQLLDAGFKVQRRIVTARDFAENWTRYPFSATNWNHRPLGVQVLSLAYRTGVAWNETGFSDPRFDALLDRATAIGDPFARRPVMAELQTILKTQGVVIQPFWQALYRHADPKVTGAAMHPTFEIDIHDLGWVAPR